MARRKKQLPDNTAEQRPAEADAIREPVKEKAAGQDQRGEQETKPKRPVLMQDENGQPYITLDPPNYDPTLDPHSPDFDRVKWRELHDAASRDFAAAISDALNSADVSMTDFAKNMLQNAAGDIVQTVERGRNAAKEMHDLIAPLYSNMQDFYKSDVWDTIQSGVKQLADITRFAAGLRRTIADIVNEYNLDLLPYLEAELEKPEYEGVTVSEFFETAGGGAGATRSLLLKALEAARAAKEAAENNTVAVKHTDTIDFPVDKINRVVWNLFENDTQGQITIDLAKDAKNNRTNSSKIKLPAYYAIDFEALKDDIQITKRLQPFDKRVYLSVSALFNAGNNVISLSQIYYTMGNIGRPSTKQLEKINTAITKMTSARIFFDNEKEAEKYKYNHFRYDGSLLPLERGTAIVNGRLADAAIHIFREPPLITFARQRRQITTLNVKVLQSPVSKTDSNLLIDDYLLERISRAKNQQKKKKNCRILYKTLYENVGISANPKTNTERQQKRRTPEKIKKYLQHYKEQEFITNYTIENDGVTVYWENAD